MKEPLRTAGPVAVTHYDSPLGRITMAAKGGALIALWFEGQKYSRELLRGCEIIEEASPVFTGTRKWLDLYFSGKDPGFIPPLKLSGSDFRQRVGRIMLTIPYGRTMTYGEIARIIAAEDGLTRMSAQAVGGAVGHNPISLIVPCHRVLGAGGSLTGYAGGVWRKERLLKIEAAGALSSVLPADGPARG